MHKVSPHAYENSVIAVYFFVEIESIYHSAEILSRAGAFYTVNVTEHFSRLTLPEHDAYRTRRDTLWATGAACIKAAKVSIGLKWLLD